MAAGKNVIGLDIGYSNLKMVYGQWDKPMNTIVRPAGAGQLTVLEIGLTVKHRAISSTYWLVMCHLWRVYLLIARQCGSAPFMLTNPLPILIRLFFTRACC